MTTERMNSLWGSVFGFLGVLVGAFAAHGLENRVSAQGLEWLEIGARYQMYHSFALFAAAWIANRFDQKWASYAGRLFILGIVLFSGSLYLMALGAPRMLGMVTPLGGTALMAGWIMLAIASIRSPRSDG